MEYMSLAIEEAKKSQTDIPVGAVIVKDGKIISMAHNMREATYDLTAHAEILAINEACKQLNNWRLKDCELYVTLEPCPMCGWAIMQSRMKSLYFGSYDTKYGCFSATNLSQISDYSPKIYGGIMEDKCDKILKDFFKSIR